MAHVLSEICVAIIGDHYGELARAIFSTLAEYGRLTIHSLADHAKLSLRRARQGLTSLLEEQLLSHYAAEDDALSYYSVNWRNAYNLARHANIAHLVEGRHGEGAGHLIRNVLQLGNARVGDLADAYHLSASSKRDSGIDTTFDHMTEASMLNGAAKTSAPKTSHGQVITTKSEFHGTMRTLLRSGILVKVGMRAYVPPSDLQERIEETVISEQFPDRKVTGPKKQHEFKLAINRLKRKWREDDTYSGLHDVSSKGTIKRPGDHFKLDHKRVKLNGKAANGLLHAVEDEQSTPKIPDDLVVRVDFVRCTLALRGQRLAKQAKHVLGGVTALVYDALLQSLEEKVRAVRDDLGHEKDEDGEEGSLPVATASEVAEFLDPNIDLGLSIKGMPAGKQMPNGHGKNGKRKHVDDEFAAIGIKREYESESDEEPTTNGYTTYRDRSKRLSLIEAHLDILEEHTKSFCKRIRSHGSSEWQVNFPAMSDLLIEAELDTMIEARHGKVALRVVRILRDRGKLDEKQVASGAMMRIRDIRAVLTMLQYQGVLEAQELPKDNARQPSRTMYLWYFDIKRVQQLYVQQTYKAMARTLQRVPVERERFRTVIEKAERTDVKGHEQEKLEQSEKQALREWREVEERLSGQVDRMDEVVALLRDFSGKDTSLNA